MKCIRCNNEDTLRAGESRCHHCNGEFAFLPGARFTDEAFFSALQNLSEDGAVKWLPGHLYFELARQRVAPNRLNPWVLGALSSMGFFVAASYAQVFAWAWIFGATSVGSALAAWLSREKPAGYLPTSREDVHQALARWCEVHGKPRGLIEKRARASAPYRDRVSDEELLGYSFDRALICDRPEIVDFFIANNFHFENNCAILGFNKYPEDVFEVVLRMLRNNPKLLVFALHDATMKGCGMAYTLANQDEWFKGRAKITDVGLRPEHADFFPGLEEPTEQRGYFGPGMSDSETAWLSRNLLSLEVIPPSQLIKRVFRAIADKEEEIIQQEENKRQAIVMLDRMRREEAQRSAAAQLGTAATTTDGGGQSFG
jgi:hypothetical protein